MRLCLEGRDEVSWWLLIGGASLSEVKISISTKVEVNLERRALG
jgi:hypothetical protein